MKNKVIEITVPANATVVIKHDNKVETKYKSKMKSKDQLAEDSMYKILDNILKWKEAGAKNIDQYAILDSMHYHRRFYGGYSATTLLLFKTFYEVLIFSYALKVSERPQDSILFSMLTDYRRKYKFFSDELSVALKN